jgi:hypothetical protein
MKRIVILSLILLAILSTGLFSLSCSCEEEVAPPTTPPPSFPSIPEEGVYLNPAFVELQPGQALSIGIEVKPSGWGASGGEISLAFDTAVLEAVSIEPGDFFGPSPIVGLERIDKQGGIIRLALARVGQTAVPSPAGILAEVDFRVLDTAASGSYEIELSVGLADQDFQDITGFTTQGATIRISP